MDTGRGKLKGIAQAVGGLIADPFLGSLAEFFSARLFLYPVAILTYSFLFPCYYLAGKRLWRRMMVPSLTGYPVVIHIIHLGLSLLIL